MFCMEIFSEDLQKKQSYKINRYDKKHLAVFVDRVLAFAIT